ncbi:hypothetical protein [Bradyrhizobium sp. SHOUNA76]|nr:hypothetical protein [Bradyrhizobium sp. SHOUNA76]
MAVGKLSFFSASEATCHTASNPMQASTGAPRLIKAAGDIMR